VAVYGTCSRSLCYSSLVAESYNVVNKLANMKKEKPHFNTDMSMCNMTHSKVVSKHLYRTEFTWLTLSLHIWEVTGPNLSPVFGYLE